VASGAAISSAVRYWLDTEPLSCTCDTQQQQQQQQRKGWPGAAKLPGIL
jgi:hypothetical protein